ncbi:hypothetical protein [Streptomyces aureoversilis]|uniref:Uncharacterized protein n=1 Tax=Streptomyces aureoversilis TaxID=67277 RepID=A0ABV9ZWH2_9ACTN
MPTPPPFDIRTLVFLALAIGSGAAAFHSAAWAVAIGTGAVVYALLAGHVR